MWCLSDVTYKHNLFFKLTSQFCCRNLPKQFLCLYFESLPHHCIFITASLNAETCKHKTGARGTPTAPLFEANGRLASCHVCPHVISHHTLHLFPALMVTVCTVFNSVTRTRLRLMDVSSSMSLPPSRHRDNHQIIIVTSEMISPSSGPLVGILLAAGLLSYIVIPIGSCGVKGHFDFGTI